MIYSLGQNFDIRRGSALYFFFYCCRPDCFFFVLFLLFQAAACRFFFGFSHSIRLNLSHNLFINTFPNSVIYTQNSIRTIRQQRIKKTKTKTPRVNISWVIGLARATTLKIRVFQHLQCYGQLSPDSCARIIHSYFSDIPVFFLSFNVLLYMICRGFYFCLPSSFRFICALLGSLKIRIRALLLNVFNIVGWLAAMDKQQSAAYNHHKCTTKTKI